MWIILLGGIDRHRLFLSLSLLLKIWMIVRAFRIIYQDINSMLLFVFKGLRLYLEIGIILKFDLYKHLTY
jgi:hypothetical protein